MSRENDKNAPVPSTLLSIDKEVKEIGHSMGIGNTILGVNSVTISYLIRYESLLENATDILLQNATAILLPNATEVYCKMRQVFYYKMRQLYYKMRQSFEIVTILLQNATFIANGGSTIISLVLVFIGLNINCPYIQLPSR